MNDAVSEKGGEREDELEVGEPIEDEVASSPVKKKIRARVVPFDGRSPHRSKPGRDQHDTRAEQTELSNSSGGQMVLTTAKYMPQQSVEPESRREHRSKKGQPSEPASSLEGKVLNSGKWGGMLAMTIAAIWFMAGIVNDTVFIYPPILFVIGLVAFVKDASGSE
ncbi:hypothetical protein GobsT_00760 [Gemmata obscuriglobus]|uniref:Uncharacterized protein n=1 Tax=Gemmata obscuriglobus TaxID=114 RepID=A0A2Z3H3D4_9BACT|nr:hypothetical protein [Gemmata obscuriglobus]AWM41299.1 hypothetical protein C1280_32760 [Gemmata obscuriglobus]QEG25351.1 hypothetical protein GobsT_00760 [Gemmata obscuriglobus]VTR98315.1 unnamed protein product [Gemmata obscuriglobus UQM 2246]